MSSFLRNYAAFLLFLLNFSTAYSQYVNSRTCIGGTGDEIIYPKYSGDNSSLYNFKSNDGGSIYFFYSNSTDGDFSSNKGYNDLYALKINSRGQIEFIKNLGNPFFEDDFIVKQSSDSSQYFILRESHSNDSLNVNGYIGDITIQYSLININSSGDILWNKTVYNAVNHIDNYSFSNYPNWFHLFIDRSDNCIVQYNKIGVNMTARSYYNDSIIYAKIDKNGNTVWEKNVSPFSIYNNSDPSFQIDTFYIGTTTFQNNFTETTNKYILSAYLSRFYPSQSRGLIYTLDKNTAAIESVLIDSTYGFNYVGIRDQFITYGNYTKYVADSSNTYSFFHIRKYDEQLHEQYEKEKMYNIPFEYFWGGSFSYSILTNCAAVPYFNTDSTQIWFSTTANTSRFDFYFGMMFNDQIISLKTYANIINPSNGEFIRIVDLNKKRYNYLLDKINNSFYYYSTDTLSVISTSTPAQITAYNFDGTELRSKDSIRGIYSSMDGNNLLNSFCNIKNSIVLYDIDSTLQFVVLDTLLNSLMQAEIDTILFTPDYYNFGILSYNLHILDTNNYCVLQSIRKDTISGCYPNTDNIIFSTFSKQQLISSVVQKSSAAFINIFPNPNNGSFTLDFVASGSYPVSLSLFDITGKVAYQKTILHNNHSSIYLSENALSSGSYLLEIKGNDNVWIKKVVIQHQ